jgi:hypothetical protein
MEQILEEKTKQAPAVPKAVSGALMLLIFVYVGRIQELSSALEGLYLGKLVIGIIFLFFLIYKDRLPIRKPIWAYPQGKYLIAICVLLFLSFPGSVWRRESFAFIFYFYWKLLVFVFLIFRLVEGEDDIRKLCWGVTLCNGILSAAAIFHPTYVAGRVYVSSTYDPNDLALCMAMCLPFSFCLMKVTKGIKKIFILVVLSMSFLVIPRTGSRGGLLALAVVLLGFALKYNWKKALVIIPVVSVLLYLVFRVAAPDQLERYTSMRNLDNDYNQTASGGRIAVWKRGIGLIVDNPFLGSGAGTSAIAEGLTHISGKWSASHNSFLQIGTELGVFALIIHILIIWKMIRLSRQNRTWLSPGIEISSYAYCVGGFFLSWAYSYGLYFLIALSIVNTFIVSDKPKEDVET